jgi:hypothetical protein
MTSTDESEIARLKWELDEDARRRNPRLSFSVALRMAERLSFLERLRLDCHESHKARVLARIRNHDCNR